MADYDSGEITDRERLAADRQKEIVKYNADTIRNQLASQLANYDLADRQNLNSAKRQMRQNSRKNEADRFEAQRQLQNSTTGMLGSMGNTAMNASGLYNLIRMLENRNDSDNATYWGQLQENNDAVKDAYIESYNQNRIARNDAISNAEAQLRGLSGDLAANLSNINPNLYEAPGTGAANVGGTGKKALSPANLDLSSGYLMPAYAERIPRQNRNRMAGNDYFSNLMNSYTRTSNRAFS